MLICSCCPRSGYRYLKGPQPAGNRPATDYDGRAQDQLEERWEIPSPTGTTYPALLGSILVRVAAGDLEVTGSLIVSGQKNQAGGNPG